MGRSKSQRGLGKWNNNKDVVTAIEPTIAQGGRRGLASSDSSASCSSSSSPNAPIVLKRKERSKSQRGLDKWKDQLSAEDQQVLALTAARRERSNPATPRLAVSTADRDGERDGVCSPRWLDDSADDNVKRYRTGAQVNAMASLYAVNPAVFS